jgi:phosphoglycerate dehydrogenase-like enzyme
MRIFASEASVARVASALQRHEIVTVDAQGNYRLAGKTVPASEAAPDIVWMTFDSIMGGRLDQFFDIALGPPPVKWVHTQQTGLDSRRYREVVARGVPLTNSHAQAPAIADYVMANVLAEIWPIAAARTAQKSHDWKRMPFRELSGTQWLIVGFGVIGREIAKRAKGFGARIVGINRSGRPDSEADEMATLKDLPRLLPASDIVVLAAAHNDATDSLVGAGFIEATKPGAILVNIGRGVLVDDKALLAGLERNKPGLAILDVFREEPLPPGHPYWDHPKVRVTGHTSSSGHGTLVRADGFFLENLSRFESGRPLLSLVTAETI